MKDFTITLTIADEHLEQIRNIIEERKESNSDLVQTEEQLLHIIVELGLYHHIERNLKFYKQKHASANNSLQ